MKIEIIKKIINTNIARFISVDPLQFKYPIYTPFQYASNAPISNIDFDGAEGLPINTLFELTKIESEIYFRNSKNYNYLNNAYYNRKDNYYKVTSELLNSGYSYAEIKEISSIVNYSSEFSNFVTEKYENKIITNESVTNTFRHVFAQALVTRKIDKNAAIISGNAHEDHSRESLEKKFQELGKSTPIFSDFNEADAFVDFLNNEEGQKLGSVKNLSEKALALSVDENFYIGKLFERKTSNDSEVNKIYIVIKSICSNSEYKSMVNQVNEFYKNKDQNEGNLAIPLHTSLIKKQND